MNYLHQEESWTRDQIEQTQLVRLRNSVEQASRSPFYGQRLAQQGISAASIHSLDSVTQIPLTTKADLRNAYPFGLITVPMHQLVRLHASSGTTGSPVAVCHTQEDLNSWADLMARCLHMIGIRKEDVFQNIAGYGLFTGGLGIHAGAERLGCLTIPAGAGNTRRQVKLIQDMGVTVLHIIPSYALYLGGSIKEMGIDPRELSPRIALIGAEPHTEEARQRIEYMLGLKAYNSYGLSEMNGPGVAFECLAQNGLHLWEDAYFMEVLNPKTLEPVPDGEVGELVLTTLCRRGMPVLRYRTGDLTRILPGPCPCGRTHRRIDRILGRADDMLIMKGCNFYPMQVEQVLLSFPEVGENYLITLDTEDSVDIMHVQVEIREESFVEDMRILTKLQKNIAHRLQMKYSSPPKWSLCRPILCPKARARQCVSLTGATRGKQNICLPRPVPLPCAPLRHPPGCAALPCSIL